MKKTILTLLAAAAMAFNAVAVDYVMTVNLKDGQTVDFAFADQPAATFEDGEMVVTILGGVEKTKFILSEVAKMTVTQNSGVSSAKLDTCNPLFGLKAGMLYGSGLAAGTQVNVFTTNGVTVASATVGTDGAVEISTDRLAAGVYVVAAGKTSFKFKK